VLFVDGEVPKHPERRFPVLFSFKLFAADHTFMEFHISTVASSSAFRTFRPSADIWTPVPKQAGHFIAHPRRQDTSGDASCRAYRYSESA